MIWCDIYIVVKKGSGRTGSGSGLSFSKASRVKPGKLLKNEVAFKLKVQLPNDAFDHTIPEAVIEMTNQGKMIPELQVLQDYAAEQLQDDIEGA